MYFCVHSVCQKIHFLTLLNCSKHQRWQFFITACQWPFNFETEANGTETLLEKFPENPRIAEFSKYKAFKDNFKDNWFNKTYNMNISKDDLIDLLSVATKKTSYFNLMETCMNKSMGSQWDHH